MVILDNLGLVLVDIQVGLDFQVFQAIQVGLAILVGLVLADIPDGLANLVYLDPVLAVIQV